MTEIADRQGNEPMQEIIDLLDHCAWDFDSNDMSRIKTFFSDDAVAEGRVAGGAVTWGPWTGVSHIGEALASVRQSHPLWRRHQLTTHFFVELGEAQATVKLYLSLFSCENGNTPQIEATGEYLAKVSKADDRWRIDFLQVVLDSDV
jgi:hypothetical protein